MFAKIWIILQANAIGLMTNSNWFYVSKLKLNKTAENEMETVSH